MSKKIDYVSKRKIFFIISSVLVVLSILSTFFIKIAIEFKGGTMLSYYGHDAEFVTAVPDNEIGECAVAWKKL